MAHEARIDTKVVAHKDLGITINSTASRPPPNQQGNIEWLPKGHSVNKRRTGWWRFAKVMEEHGRR
jgi:hypothetical protein